MRLGLRPTLFQKDSEWSRMRKLYGGASTIWERHRHRYEVNPTYVERFEASGMSFIGRDEKGERMQLMELPSTLPVNYWNTLCNFFLFFLQIIRSSLAYKRTLSSARVRSTHHRRSLDSSQPDAGPMSSNSR